MRTPSPKTVLFCTLGCVCYAVAMFYGVQGHIPGASAGAAATLVALSGVVWRA